MSQVDSGGIEEPQLAEDPDDEVQARKDVRDAALRLLARREHSALELRHKLQLREFEPALIGDVISELAEADLQSDKRYSERFAESRVSRRFGPVRILGELRQRGVDARLAEQAVDSLEVDWLEVAAAALARLRGDPSDFRERARLTQKLSQRGFASETIRKVLSQKS